MSEQPDARSTDANSNIERLARDVQARHDALDVSRSFLVQAPAGSGKTELLTRRVLALLSVVDEPEEILAITFTVGATAEMRNRVMEALTKAKPFLNTDEVPEQHTLAVKALQRSNERGWSLLEQPRRLNIQTIDALCLSIAYSAPLLSRLGGNLQPTEDAQPLYTLAARRTLEQLGGSAPQLSSALSTLLRLRDVNFQECEKLIADMLGARDQWLEEISVAQSLSEEDWLILRRQLEAPFLREHQYVLGKLRGLLQNHTDEVRRLLALIRQVCDGAVPPAEIEEIHKMSSLDELLRLEHFDCLRSVLLTKSNSWRQKAGSVPGFKAVSKGGKSEHHAEYDSIITSIRQSAGLLQAFTELTSLPSLGYSDTEWQTIRDVFTVLLHAVGQLRIVFRERNRMDFVEAGLTAAWALSNDEVRHSISHKTRHLLVDEFQDTSRKQYDLLKSIVSEWDPEEHRTCFLVGDPMQSIYLFRNAELALFDEVQRHGFGPEVPGLEFEQLTLSQNFRSIEAIVSPINEMFELSRQTGNTGAQRFTPAVAASDIRSDDAFVLHAQFSSDEAVQSSMKKKPAADRASTVVATVKQFLPALDASRIKGDPYRIGILVRAKSHVAAIAAAFREDNIPFRAVDIEALNDRQEVRDLVSLVRALTQPMDRVAWLAILRAPWCGLPLADLHTLAGGDDRSQQARPVLDLLADQSPLMSADGQTRVQHLRNVVIRALSARYSGDFLATPNGFAAWIEQTWIDLGGEYCLDETARENVDAFFKLLATLSPAEAMSATIDTRLQTLFAAPDPSTQERCSVQVMTIHKAKGLGFDVVLLPELHRHPNQEKPPLLRRILRLQRNSNDRELLIAPIGIKGQPPSATYKWIAKLIERDELEELHRLFYVACTRARTSLHLFAHISPKKNVGLSAPSHRVLLACGWEYLKSSAIEQYEQCLRSQETVQPLPVNAKAGPSLVPVSPPSLNLAAVAEKHLQTRRRLPSNWTREKVPDSHTATPTAHAAGTSSKVRERAWLPSLAARARGTTLHALFEQLASLAANQDRWNLKGKEDHWRAVATALLRNAGLSRREVEVQAKTVLSLLISAADDPNARWMLSKQAHELNEASWTTTYEGSLKTIRCDRIFVAGAEPLKDGCDHLWIVDYKTADVEADDTFLLEEQSRYAPQLTRYAEALSGSAEFVGKHMPIVLALYYPALQRLQWWPA